jgi:hypothetical protein
MWMRDAPAVDAGQQGWVRDEPEVHGAGECYHRDAQRVVLADLSE